MPGSNARVRTVTNTAFTPSDSTATARISVRSATNGAFGSVKNAYLNPSTNIWVGAPPIPTAPTYRNVRTGTFPNLNNSIWVDWTSDTSGIIASFDVFVKIGAGAYSLAANVSAATRTYNYGAIAANTTYSFYVRTNGVSGLTTTSPESSTSLASPGLVSVLGTARTGTTATVSWTVNAGVFQKYFVYDNATPIATVNGTELGTSFSYQRTGLALGTSYNFKVYGQNLDGLTGLFREVNITTTDVPSVPATPTITAADSGDTINWAAPNDGGTAITGYYYKVSTNDQAYGGETFVAAASTLSYPTGNQYSPNKFKIQVRAVNANGTSGFSTASANTVVWVNEGASFNNPDGCPAPTCSACPAPTCSACTAPTCPSCGDCPSCAGGCDACGGTRTSSGNKGTSTGTAGTRGASTLGTRGASTIGTSTRTCYRWTRTGSTSSGYDYNIGGTAACSAFPACTDGTCGDCTAGTCGDCTAGTCSACVDTCTCSACSASYYKLVPIQYFQYNYMPNFLGDGVDWFGMYTAEGFWPSNNPYGGCCCGERRVWFLYRCSNGFTENSRIGQKEENTGVCAYEY